MALQLCRRTPTIQPFLSRYGALYQGQSGLSTSSSSVHVEDEEGLLVGLLNARLGHSIGSLTKPLDLSVKHPSAGGHALLGRNGSGKTLVSNSLVSHQDFVHHGDFLTDSNYQSIQNVSFESHEALLAQGGTTYRAIGTGNINKAAQFLIVRFGLYPLLHREVSTLSTGEIRKVLLVRALSTRPRLLVLDNAFDGLDVPSRQSLKYLVSKTLQGFRPDILVQGVNAYATAHTQVFLITHRAEEIVDEIKTVSFWNEEQELLTEARQGRSGEQLLKPALSGESQQMMNVRLPTINTIASWWQTGEVSSHISPLVQANKLNVKRGEATLIHQLDWEVKLGEHWLIAGPNGSGKSTLSRLLARKEEGIDGGNLVLSNDNENMAKQKGRRRSVGWVSTELHMSLSKSPKTVLEVIDAEGATSAATISLVSDWFDIGTLLPRPFAELSQGQQKMVLIAAAVASRPRMLVLDEPCQGLDLLNREKLLRTVERICQATDVCLIYITHHFEEMVPSIDHVLHLAQGKAVFNGRREDYDPNHFATEDEKEHA